MKIKTKKEMNLPQLIEYAWDNDIKNEIFIADKQLINIEFDDTGDVLIYGNGSIKTVKFSIEVEEEITLTTPLPSMLHIWKTEVLGTEMKEVKNKSIASQYTICSTEFWLKEDNEMTLIWRDGKLVE